MEALKEEAKEEAKGGLTSPICVIDTETTGLVPYSNEVVGICILPLNPDFSINEEVKPFNVKVQPENWDTIQADALKVNGETVESLRTYPQRRETITALSDWFKAVGFGDKYDKIHVLAHNAPFDKSFMSCWLDPGRKYEDALGLFTHYRWRCSQAAANFLNDCAKAKGLNPLFPNLALTQVAKAMGFTNPAPHTAYGDCVTTAYIYGRMTNVLLGGGKN